MSKIKTIYIAGAITPYPDRNPVEDYWDNIRRGIHESLMVVEAGFYPFCPFLDFLFYLMPPNSIKVSEKLLKKLDFPWLERCDALLVLSKYRKSQGTKDEIARARELKIPVFYSLDDLIAYTEDTKNET